MHIGLASKFEVEFVFQLAKASVVWAEVWCALVKEQVEKPIEVRMRTAKRESELVMMQMCIHIYIYLCVERQNPQNQKISSESLLYQPRETHLLTNIHSGISQRLISSSIYMSTYSVKQNIMCHFFGNTRALHDHQITINPKKMLSTIQNHDALDASFSWYIYCILGNPVTSKPPNQKGLYKASPHLRFISVSMVSYLIGNK